MSWTLIEHQALSSSVASVTLGSGGTIPQTYKTLKLVISARSDRASQYFDDIAVQFNGSTSNLSSRWLYGSGSTPGSSSSASVLYGGSMDATQATANTFASISIDIPNYSGSTNKPVSVDSVNEDNSSQWTGILSAGLWSNTAAITSLLVKSNTGANFVSGSTFTLYGLA